MRQKVLLGVAALAVLAMIAGLMIALRSDDGPVSTGSATSALPSSAAEYEAPAIPPPEAPAPSKPEATTTRPAAPAAQEGRAQPLPAGDDDDGAGPTEVRDHRGAGPTAPPSPLRPTTIAAARQALEPPIRECASALPADTPRPLRFVAHSTLRSGGARVTSQGFRLSGAEALGPQFADCVEKAYATLSTEAGTDQPDGEDMVHMPWTIP